MELFNINYLATVSNPLAALSVDNVTSVLGLDDELFKAQRKKEAYDNPQSYLDNRINVLNGLNEEAKAMYEAYMTGDDKPWRVGEGDNRQEGVAKADLPASLMSEWKSLPLKKKQELALKMVYAKMQGKLEALEAFYPTSFKKTAKQTLSLSALKKSLTD